MSLPETDRLPFSQKGRTGVRTLRDVSEGRRRRRRHRIRGQPPRRGVGRPEILRPPGLRRKFGRRGPGTGPPSRRPPTTNSGPEGELGRPTRDPEPEAENLHHVLSGTRWGSTRRNPLPVLDGYTGTRRRVSDVVLRRVQAWDVRPGN